MTKLVALYKESGQSQKEFAVSHGVSEGKLHYWITKISKPEKVKPVSKKVGFVPIEVVPGQVGRTILIRCTSGVEIEIPV